MGNETKKSSKISENKNDKSKISKDRYGKDSSSFYYAASLAISIVFIAIAIGVYKVYQDVTTIPDMPDFDLNKCWGPNTTGPQDTSIRPYKIVFSDAMEVEIRWLFEQYRKGNKIESFPDTAWTYGINSEAFSEFFDYWIFKYKFKSREKFLNQFPHYKTNIQGLDIHYIHVKPNVSENVMRLPLLMLHGWPGSVREFYEAIIPLTTERPEYNFVFEIIAPSLPGFGFSQAAVRPGLSPKEVAIIMRNLMHRLGHKYYYIQGGDFGHAVGSNIATLFPNEVLGYHTNMPVNFSKYAHLTWILGAVWPTFVANEHPDRMYPLGEKIKYFLEEFGYMHLQGTKPDTIGIALQDSPTGLASYILDRFMVFTDINNKFKTKGGFDKYYDYDKLLDNIMIYWVTDSITSAMRMYKESFGDGENEQILALIPASAPVWGLRFKHEVQYSPDFILKWKFPNLLGTTNYEYGGHFAAFERPEEFSNDIFRAVKAFLEYHKMKK